MMKGKSKRPLMLFLLSACCAGTAQATVVSNVATATANATFQKSGNVTVTITPKTGLMAGNISKTTVLADVIIKPSSESDSVVYRFTPSSGVLNSSENELILSGKNNPDNKLTVFLNYDDDIGGNNNPTEWIHGSVIGTRSATVNSSITSEDVPADTYTVSIDAAVWSN